MTILRIYTAIDQCHTICRCGAPLQTWLWSPSNHSRTERNRGRNG